jgi:hypothetical protein
MEPDAYTLNPFGNHCDAEGKLHRSHVARLKNVIFLVEADLEKPDLKKHYPRYRRLLDDCLIPIRDRADVTGR